MFSWLSGKKKPNEKLYSKQVMKRNAFSESKLNTGLLFFVINVFAFTKCFPTEKKTEKKKNFAEQYKINSILCFYYWQLRQLNTRTKYVKGNFSDMIKKCDFFSLHIFSIFFPILVFSVFYLAKTKETNFI